MLSLHTNTSALQATTSLQKASSVGSISAQRLSSGYRINSAKDDAAGLAISTRMDAQSRGMQVAQRNAQNAISFMQTAEGAMGTGSNILQRMRDLAVQAADGAMSDSDRLNLDKEYQALSQEFTSIFEKTEFNGMKILGDKAGDFTFQIGANKDETLEATTIDGATLFATAGDLKSTGNAGTAIGALDTAITATATARADLGAVMSRLDYINENLQTSITNTDAAKGRIKDVDYAQEMANYTKNQILQQSSASMLSKSLQSSNLVLSLLG